MDELKKSLQKNETLEEDPFKIEELSEEEKQEVQSGKDKKMNIFQKLKDWFTKLNKKQKIFFVSGVTFGAILMLIVFVFIFKLDTYLFPSSIAGYIYNQDDEAIEGASVCINDKCTNTAVNGSYVLGNLRYGESVVNINAENYKELRQEVGLKRGRIERNFTLEPAGFGDVLGKLMYKNEEAYDFSQVSFYLDSEELDVKPDGMFEVLAAPIGDYELRLESVDFKDELLEIEINEGVNNLGEIELTPAADLTAKVVDWTTLGILPGTSVVVGEKTETVNEDGFFTLKDLAIQEKITLDFFYEGYITKQSEYDLVQGLNEPIDIELVRSGRVVYVSNRVGNQNVYISNYDGSGEKMLSDNKGDNYSPYLSNDGRTVYFLSTRDQLKNAYGYVMALAYSVSSEGGPLTKISKTNYEDFGGSIGSYDFVSKKRVFVIYTYHPEPYKLTMYFGNLDGTDMKNVLELSDGYIGSDLVANNGDFIVYSLNGSEDPGNRNGVYYLNPASVERRMILEAQDGSYAYVMDISNDRQRVLVRMYDAASNKWDLWVVGVFDNKKVRITDTSTDELQARFTPNSDFVSFISNRDAKSDVYMIEVSGSNESQVTRDGNVDDYFFGAGNLVFFNSEKKMWVIDSLNPKKSQEVTERVLGTYYSSHYYYYPCCD
ncbi:PD40 domain-containing protein [Candidatus Dojkabacteria bacterium]|nr:PD40 domain-containing protein [Candidatus Dojkabacteria bacterium]